MNQYAKYFNEDMTEEEIRHKYYSLMEELPWWTEQDENTKDEIEELWEAYVPVRDKIMDREGPAGNPYSKYFNAEMTDNQARGRFFSLALEMGKNGGTEADLEELNQAYRPISRKISDRESKLAQEGWLD